MNWFLGYAVLNVLWGHWFDWQQTSAAGAAEISIANLNFALVLLLLLPPRLLLLR